MRRWHEIVVVTMTLIAFTVFVVGASVLLVKAKDDGNRPPAKPLQAWTFDDHKWVTFQVNGGVGLSHHPDCPCKEK